MPQQIEPLDENIDHAHFIEFLNAKIDEEAKFKRNLPPLFHYAFHVKDKDRSIGGIFGFDNFGALHIEGLWVDPNYRAQGIGKSLVKKAEELALQRKCRCITLFTMDFQALEFYRHLDYVEEFRRPYYHANSFATYMIKTLLEE